MKCCEQCKKDISNAWATWTFKDKEFCTQNCLATWLRAQGYAPS